MGLVRFQHRPTIPSPNYHPKANLNIYFIMPLNKSCKWWSGKGVRLVRKRSWFNSLCLTFWKTQQYSGQPYCHVVASGWSMSLSFHVDGAMCKKIHRSMPLPNNMPSQHSIFHMVPCSHHTHV